jgi:hypothetical protein
MKVFLSWSGDYSRRVADLLQDWLPQVLNEVEPFISTSIDAGARWQAEVASQLEEAHFGIVVVTTENQRRPWLNFEAGAIAKAVTTSRLVPIAVDLGPTDIELPLGQFQAQRLDKAGVQKLVHTLNAGLSRPRAIEQVDKAVKIWWPELEGRMNEVKPDSTHAAEPSRSERDLLEEVLESVREIRRTSGGNADAEDRDAGSYLERISVKIARQLSERATRQALKIDISWMKPNVITIDSSTPLPSDFVEFALDLSSTYEFSLNFASGWIQMSAP